MSFDPEQEDELTYRLNEDLVIRYYPHETKLDVLIGKKVTISDAVAELKNFQFLSRPETKSTTVEYMNYTTPVAMTAHHFTFKESERAAVKEFLSRKYKCVF